MPVGDFVQFVDSNPQIRTIELGNSGEVFLNPALPAMLAYAAEKGVSVRIAEGANLNDVTDEALEALVRYGVRILRVAIDGVTQETYEKYRVGGDLKKALGNVQRIDEYKKRYGSDLPRMILQFIPFGHNEHEIDKAFVLAKAMGMDFHLKLNVFSSFSPLRNHELLTERIGYSDKASYREKTGKVYLRDICLQLWRAPQVNWDGRLLGCSANTSVNYADYALGSAFGREINNERMQYARKMLMGREHPRDDIPCFGCECYADYSRYDQWFSPDEIAAAMERGQW
jgi:hypothetical protein